MPDSRRMLAPSGLLVWSVILAGAIPPEVSAGSRFSQC
jgi:hypothetical protein